MPSSPTLFFMVVFFLESLAAVMQNGLMAAALGREWVRGRVLPAGDKIVACVAASRFGVHALAFTNHLLIILNFRHKVRYFDLLWDFSNLLTFWLTALLSVFYCVKIASFSHPAFLWLRWRLSRAVPRLLLGTLPVSIMSNIPAATGNIVLSHIEASQLAHANSSWTAWWRVFHQNFFFLNMLLMLLVPFLLFLASTALLMFSLHRHLSQMRGSRPGPRDPSTQAHTAALKSLGFFLVFFSSYFLFLLVAVKKFIPAHLYWYWAWQGVTYAGISLHSTILLLGSPRLRGALKNGLQGCRAIGCRRANRGQVPPVGLEKEPVQGR